MTDERLLPLTSKTGKRVPAFRVLQSLPGTELVMRGVYKNLTGVQPDSELLQKEIERSDNIATALEFLVIREYIDQGLI